MTTTAEIPRTRCIPITLLDSVSFLQFASALSASSMVSHNADTVQSRLARLTDEYDPDVLEERETTADEFFSELAGYAADGYTGGGYAWVIRERPPDLSASMPDADELDEPYPRVLLGYGRGDGAWGPAGGGRENGETYEEATEREVFEEAGVECTVTDCRSVRHLVSESETGDDTIRRAVGRFPRRGDGRQYRRTGVGT
ncbi:MAG: NUDIX domain-containing protein [Halobacteriales archaeon]|nr:NUDIX domain-containing protein [Halobacteriales archaeon]